MLIQNALLWAQIAALAFFGSLAISGFMCAAGLGDSSDGRSAHKGVVPTSGGVGIIAGFGLALCGFHFLFPNVDLPQGFAPVMALLFAVGLLGLCDDILTLGPKLKFGIMIVICGAAVWSIGAPSTLPGLGDPIALPPVVGFAGAMLWIFVVMNALNFIDGANGMLGLTLSIAFFALFGVGIIGQSPTTLLLSGLGFMTLLGFLPYNVRVRARIFSGDIGALSLGFLFAVTILFLLAETKAQTFHLIGPVLILPLLADVLLTLVRRAVKKENLLQAHNTHLYQRLIQHGFGHLTVSWFYALAALLCANAVVIGASQGWFNDIGLFSILVGLFAVTYILVSRVLTNASHNKSR